MDHVVYLLGAGFSAPLGIPVMSEFLMKSKDMYAADAQRYAHFDSIFREIQRMSVAKNYYATDLYNIEEILSLLEIRDFVEGRRFADEFRKYIVDVVEHYTPPFRGAENLPSNWPGLVFGKDSPWREYGYFVMNLFGLQISKDDLSPTNLRCKRVKPRAKYSVVSLNYDLVLETIAEYLHASNSDTKPIAFSTDVAGDPPILCKLHGSVDSGTIVPPTWSKGTHSDIIPTWKVALSVLERANHIRVIGYSLPTADTYVRYLLRAAALTAPHLKQFDVLCLDPHGDVKQRYDDFIDFPRYRFRSASVSEYFAKMMDLSFKGYHGKPGWHQTLEDAHEQFFSG